ncbi:NAD-glutamate dehydrogenase domain-containing protein [Seleniivibrio sp.]|uniref:NAD-glutamate dehydrogenase domain-containing protein n=1 Tax=Seleniivibrio sp. TaxID=2898801 RepID=UPI0025FE2D91|nr:NAD-glutamate dehydrogenase domain-containing protein [Seleniivibrio sp.]MCD8552756.1 NAD-glutamate dehydrogenase [Seleniivibrio sp.]
MINPSLFNCVTRTDFGQNRLSMLTKRHENIFSKYKNDNILFYNFAGLMINHMPANFLSFLSDEDLDGFFLYLFKIFDGRKKKKLSVVAEALETKPFFVGNFSLVSIITDDRPFLYDSVWAYFQENETKELFILHPIFSTERDKQGNLTKVSETAIGSKNESFFLIFLEHMEVPQLKNITKNLSSVYECVMAAVDDFHRMTELMHNLASELRESEPEVSRFIHWLLQDNFIWQGARVINIKTEDASMTNTDIGICTLSAEQPDAKALLSVIEGGKLNYVDGHPVVVDISLERSKVKTRGYLNRLMFVDRHEKFVRVVEVFGKFTYKGRRCPPHEIPIVRDKIKQALDHFNFVHGSHDYKWVRSLIDDFPKIELFNFNTRLTIETLELILTMQGSEQIRICYRDFRPLNNLFFFIALPFEKYSTELVADLREFLAEFFDAELLDTSVREDEHKRYYMHFHLFLRDTETLIKIDDNLLKNRILSMLRTWDANLYDLLHDRLDSPDIDRVYARYVSAFNDVYRSRNSPEAGFADIMSLERLEGVKARIYAENGRAILKIYAQSRFLLTQLMPVLDNIGLKVYEEDTFRLQLEDGERYINAVYLADIEYPEEFCDMYKENVPQLMVHVLSGTAENDRLNGLAVTSSLKYRQIAVLRALRNFIRQIDTSFTLITLTNAFTNNPDIAGLIVRLFEAKFDPSVKKADIDGIIQMIMPMIDRVVSAAEDKALRDCVQVLGGMVRTNYYCAPERPYISFKVRSRELDIIPEPRPLFEIFVHSAQMDGIHLRGGKVARGGLRFSDRPDDYRTEILGLVKTQMVKNAVIVPVGSKGGFIVKTRYKDKTQDKDNVIAQYKNYIRALLDVTDNIKNGKVVHPDNVKIYDEKDPYLVVAADKGTAAFSDIANSVSVERGFWLGDAFASGGSVGYDHKKVGITAKGAWECVKRHFRETGKDIQKEEFTVFGIGDMGGDVFGNGMLLSKKILLQAAFNHMHIFLDPAPDAEKSFAERKRLFAVGPAGSWADYDRTIISEGGGIFERSAKKIELSQQVRAMLDTDKQYLSGEELIGFILRMRAELMWNGGIGTYVRATSETNAQVGDPANDSVRITSHELRAVVVGEGGNLGFTQKARIEYAENGGKINTDALDNSAGVDMSDHEVNLKIMFSKLMKDGDMKDFAERNRYIKKLTSQVEALVLRDNYLQSGCISMAQRGYESSPVIYREFAKHLRDRKLLDFNIEKIEFVDGDKAPTRPELCVLLAYSKIFLYGEIEQGLDVNDELVKREYMSYYPADMQAQYGEKLYDHILRREIAATVIINRLINRTGPVFFYELYKNNNIDFSRLVNAYMLAEDALELKSIRLELESFDGKAETESVYTAMSELEKTMKVATVWIADEARAQRVRERREEFGEIVRLIPRHLSAGLKENHDAMCAELIEGGIPSSLAKRIAAVRYAKAAFDIFDIHVKTGRAVRDILSAYYEADSVFSITELTSGIKSVKIRTEWERVNMESLVNRLKQIQKMTAVFLCDKGRAGLNGLKASERTFFENYNAFLMSVRSRDIDSLVPYNVVADMFSRLAEKFGEN